MSLTSDDLADIKQLMQAVVYQSNATQKDEIMQAVRKELQELREEVDDRFDEQDGKLDVILDALVPSLLRSERMLMLSIRV